MATFTGQLISATYDAILKTIDNDAIGGTAKQLTDGLGNVTPLYVSTTQLGIGITPTEVLDVSGNIKASATVFATTFSGDLSGTINTATTGTTQTAGDDSTKIATTAFVQASHAGKPTGSGTGGKVALWSGSGVSTTLTDSAITQESTQLVFSRDIRISDTYPSFTLEDNDSAGSAAKGDIVWLDNAAAQKAIISLNNLNLGITSKGGGLTFGTNSTPAASIDASQNTILQGNLTTGGNGTTNSGAVIINGGITQNFSGSAATTNFLSIQNTATASASSDASQFKIIQKDTSAADIEYSQGLIATGNAYFGTLEGTGSVKGMNLNIGTGNATFSGNLTVDGTTIHTGSTTFNSSISIISGNTSTAELYFGDTDEDEKLKIEFNNSSNSLDIDLKNETTGVREVALKMTSSREFIFEKGIEVKGSGSTFESFASDMQLYLRTSAPATGQPNVIFQSNHATEGGKITTEGVTTIQFDKNQNTTFAGTIKTTAGTLTLVNGSNTRNLSCNGSGNLLISNAANSASIFHLQDGALTLGTTIGTGSLSLYAGAATFGGDVITDGIYKMTTSPDGNILELDQGGRSMDIGVYFASNSTDSEWQFKTSTGNVNGTTTNALVVKPLLATFAGNVTASAFLTSNGSFTQNGFWGTTINAGSGSLADFALLNSATAGIMYNPTGTLNMVFQGNVGVGGSPVLKLEVQGTASSPTPFGSAAINGVVRIAAGGTNPILDIGSNSAAPYEMWLQAHVPSNTYGTPISLNPLGGNVGIGTRSPSTKLDVVGSTTNGSGVVDTLKVKNEGTTANDGPRIQFTSGTSTSGAAIGSQGKALNSADLLFYAGGNTEIMRITRGGNVGIGTDSPDTLLEIVGADPILTLRDTSTSGADSHATLRLAESGSGSTLNLHYDISLDESALTFNYDSANTGSPVERMRIDSSGNLKLAITNATSNTVIGKDGTGMYMETSGSTDALSDMRFQARASGAGNYTIIKIKPSNQSLEFYTSNAERMRITSAGAVLVGKNSKTDTPTYGGVAILGDTASAGVNDYSQVFVEHNSNENHGIGIKELSGSGGNAIGFINSLSAVVGRVTTTTTSTAYGTSSDYRLKEDLQDFAGLDMVSKIPVYDFKWKSDESRSYGVMAHELQEVLPDAVSGEKDAEEMQGVDYSKIVPLLVKSIQELKAEVDKLKQECKCK